MDITPIIPDGYNGPIKQLTYSICKHMFYVTQNDYHRLSEIRFCHECSLILREELEKTQGASPLTPPPVREKPVARTPLLYQIIEATLDSDVTVYITLVKSQEHWVDDHQFGPELLDEVLQTNSRCLRWKL